MEELTSITGEENRVSARSYYSEETMAAAISPGSQGHHITQDKRVTSHTRTSSMSSSASQKNRLAPNRSEHHSTSESRKQKLSGRSESVRPPLYDGRSRLNSTDEQEYNDDG